jgi:hypothetical protein
VVAWDDDAHGSARNVNIYTGAQLASQGVTVTITETPGATLLLFYYLGHQ